MATVDASVPYVEVNALARFNWTQEFQYLNDNGVAIDLTGYTATITFRRPGELGSINSPALTKTSPVTGLTLTPLEGKILVNITVAEQATASLVGMFRFALYVTSVGLDTPIAIGAINFQPNAK